MISTPDIATRIRTDLHSFELSGLCLPIDIRRRQPGGQAPLVRYSSAMGADDERVSRTTTPQPRTLIWKFARVRLDQEQAPILQEIQVLTAGVTQAEAEMRRAELKAYLLRAAEGRLVRPRELIPVRGQSEVWEIRWIFQNGDHFRMYHAEPESDPDLLLALLFHKKEFANIDSETIRMQNLKMREAASRFFEGRRVRWGLA